MIEIKAMLMGALTFAKGLLATPTCCSYNSTHKDMWNPVWGNNTQ